MKYLITGTVTVSCWTEVDAETREEALKICSNRDLAGMCIDGSSTIYDSFHFDTDGVPQNLVVEEQ